MDRRQTLERRDGSYPETQRRQTQKKIPDTRGRTKGIGERSEREMRQIGPAFEVSLRRRREQWQNVQGWEVKRVLPHRESPGQQALHERLTPEYEGISGKHISGKEPWLRCLLTEFQITIWTGGHVHTNAPEWFSQQDRSRISSWPKAPDGAGSDQVTTRENSEISGQASKNRNGKNHPAD